MDMYPESNVLYQSLLCHHIYILARCDSLLTTSYIHINLLPATRWAGRIRWLSLRTQILDSTITRLSCRLRFCNRRFGLSRALRLWRRLSAGAAALLPVVP
jgi:hypothetical protein